MLVVGNWDLTRHQIDETSSLGPAHDGRIKPDVVAPGRTVVRDPEDGVQSAGYCRVDPDTLDPFTVACLGYDFNEERRNFYQLLRGTSMAAHATTGTVALVLERCATTYGVNLDQKPPLPSTLRGLADPHSARPSRGPVDTERGRAPFTRSRGLTSSPAGD